MTKNENRINKLFEELVPTSGKADSLAGELVRATARIGYRFFNDGDMVNQGYGKETCNPAARFLIAKGNAEISSLTVALWEIFSEDAYEKVLDTLEGAVADYIKQTPTFAASPPRICGITAIWRKTGTTAAMRKRTTTTAKMTTMRKKTTEQKIAGACLKGRPLFLCMDSQIYTDPGVNDRVICGLAICGT